jgi:hypothetical protein
VLCAIAAPAINERAAAASQVLLMSRSPIFPL